MGYDFGFHFVWSFQAHIFKSTDAEISRFWSILGILGPFAFSVSPFRHLFWGRDSLEKRKILEEYIYVCIYVQDL